MTNIFYDANKTKQFPCTKKSVISTTLIVFVTTIDCDGKVVCSRFESQLGCLLLCSWEKHNAHFPLGHQIFPVVVAQYEKTHVNKLKRALCASVVRQMQSAGFMRVNAKTHVKNCQSTVRLSLGSMESHNSLLLTFCETFLIPL